MTRDSLSALALAGALLVGSGAGCGRSGPSTVRVWGDIKLDGAPLPEAQVRFEPMPGTLAQGRMVEALSEQIRPDAEAGSESFGFRAPNSDIDPVAVV